jgi:hypothetical protein
MCPKDARPMMSKVGFVSFTRRYSSADLHRKFCDQMNPRRQTSCPTLVVNARNIRTFSLCQKLFAPVLLYVVANAKIKSRLKNFLGLQLVRRGDCLSN